jgi:hypothetical protein
MRYTLEQAFAEEDGDDEGHTVQFTNVDQYDEVPKLKV